MGIRRIDQVWLVGGFLAIALVVTGSWFLLISPKFAEADEVQASADGSGLQLIKLNKEVAALNEQEKQKPTLLRQLHAKQIALPNTYNMPAFVRQLQDIGNEVDVDVSGLTFGTPARAMTVPDAVDLPITLVAKGSPANLSEFLTRLQTGQPRAVLVHAVGLTIAKPGSADPTSANISLSAFCLQTGSAEEKASPEACTAV
jgi:Tfp pilus assembly protein PilO